MDKLISMVNFVLEQSGIYNTYESELELKTIRSYANFLKQPLKLEMFVCVDDEGNVLKNEFGKVIKPKGFKPVDLKQLFETDASFRVEPIKIEE